MFAIGEFARHGRVSVRMLRHYDAIGLLEPVSVDPASGYRFYEAAQLSRLNRIIALKDLGFTLQQVASILGVVVKRIAPLLVAELTGTAAGYEPESITPVIQPLCHQLPHQLCGAGVAITGPPVACYTDADGDAGAIEVHAALPIAARPAGQHDFRVVDLPEVPAAATLIHHGSMDHVLPSVQALARWIDANGYRSLGYARELTLEFGANRDQWVTELQEPITA